MHPLVAPASLLVIMLVSVLMLICSDRVQSWPRRRELDLLVLAAPIISLGISIADLRVGTGRTCFLGPLPLDYRLNIALALGMGLVAMLGLLGGALRLVLFQCTIARRGGPAGPALEILIATLAARLGCTRPRILIYAHDRPLALTYGFYRPTLLLSTWMVAQLDDHEFAAVVAHELGHIVRRDYAVVWLATILRDAFSYLPTSRLAYRRLQQDKEPACDDLAAQATRRPLALASALAKVWQQVASGQSIGMAQSLTAAHTSMEARITRLLAQSWPADAPSTRHLWALAGGALALGGLLLFAVVNAAALLAPMGCGAATRLEKLF